MAKDEVSQVSICLKRNFFTERQGLRAYNCQRPDTGVPVIDCVEPPSGRPGSGPMLGAVARHELNTPLFAITASAEMLLDGSVGPLTQEAQEIVALLAKAAQQLNERLALLDELQSYAVAPAPAITSLTLGEVVDGRHLEDDHGAPVEPANIATIVGCLGELQRVWTLLGVGRNDKLVVAFADTTVTFSTAVPVIDAATGEGAIACALAGQLTARSGGLFCEQECGVVDVVLRRSATTVLAC